MAESRGLVFAFFRNLVFAFFRNGGFRRLLSPAGESTGASANAPPRSRPRSCRPTEKTRTQIRFGPLASIDTLQPLFIYMFEGALEQHSIEADPALYNRIGFRDGGFGISRICARPTHRRFLATLRGRHLARPATIVGTRTWRIFGQGHSSYRRPCCRLGCPHQAKRAHRGDGPAAKAIKEGNFENVDLTLLSIDEQKLLIYLQMRRMPLCEKNPWPGEPVIVAIPKRRGARVSFHR
jgi:hypothetical protein